MKKAILASIFVSIILISCSKSGSTGGGGGGGGTTTVDCNTIANKAFAADVSPIISSSCATAGCHAAGSGNGPGPLTNHTQIFAARTSIRSAVSNGTMPKNSSLSTSQKNSIICWIDSGAPNN